MRPQHLLTATLGLLIAVGCNRGPMIQPVAPEHIDLTYTSEGETYHLIDTGQAFREVEPGKSWEYVTRVFDPEEVRRSYVEEDGIIYRVASDTQRRFKTKTSFEDSFDDIPPGLAGLSTLVSEQRHQWGSFTLQSPAAPDIPDYVRLRAELLAGKSDFRDCRLETTAERAHSGPHALKCVAPAKPSSMVTCKASLSSPLVYFRHGDHFWYEAYYWAEESLPLTLVDLECEFVSEHPGIRLRIFEDGALGIELKALDKPTYRQPAASRVTFPLGRWVGVRVHYQLSTTAGLMEVWQDGQQVLQASGITLPFRSAIYNSLEIGISAHSDPKHGCVLYVDDVRCAPSEFPH